MVPQIVMPYAYFISGVGFVSNFGSIFSFLFGGLLMLLACVIWLRKLESPHNKSHNSTKQT